MCFAKLFDFIDVTWSNKTQVGKENICFCVLWQLKSRNETQKQKPFCVYWRTCYLSESLIAPFDQCALNEAASICIISVLWFLCQGEKVIWQESQTLTHWLSEQSLTPKGTHLECYKPIKHTLQSIFTSLSQIHSAQLFQVALFNQKCSPQCFRELKQVKKTIYNRKNMQNVLNSVLNHSVYIPCPNWESSPEKRPLKATRCASTALEVLGATSKVLWRLPVEFKETKCSLRKDEAIPLRALCGNVEDFKSKFSKPVQRNCNRRHVISLGCALNSLTHSYRSPAVHGRTQLS